MLLRGDRDYIQTADIVGELLGRIVLPPPDRIVVDMMALVKGDLEYEVVDPDAKSNPDPFHVRVRTQWHREERLLLGRVVKPKVVERVSEETNVVISKMDAESLDVSSTSLSVSGLLFDLVAAIKTHWNEYRYDVSRRPVVRKIDIHLPQHLTEGRYTGQTSNLKMGAYTWKFTQVETRASLSALIMLL